MHVFEEGGPTTDFANQANKSAYWAQFVVLPTLIVKLNLPATLQRLASDIVAEVRRYLGKKVAVTNSQVGVR